MYIYIENEDQRSAYLEQLLVTQDNGIPTTIDKADMVYVGFNKKSIYQYPLKQGTKVYSMLYDKEMAMYCKQYHAKYDYLYRDEKLKKQNTILTTQGLLAYMIDTQAVAIDQRKVLILGYGMCGKDLAYTMKALGASVCVATRNEKNKEEIETNYRYHHLETLQDNNFDTIINTIPYPIIQKEYCEHLNESTMIYDIASFPYGLSKDASFINYLIVPSIPAKKTYKSAAIALYQSIIKKEDDDVKK